MRRFPVSVVLCSFALILGMSACGGDSDNAPSGPASATIVPANLSLNYGDVGQVTASALDSGGTGVLAEFEYTSSDPNLVQVSPAGAVCAGKWDANFIVCTPATTAGSATITAKILRIDKSITATSKVYIHQKVDTVQVAAPAAGCISVEETVQLQAKAYSNDTVVCGGATPCEIPADIVGPATWGAVDPTVVKFDNAATPGLAKGAIPGITRVWASLGRLNSPSVPVNVCPVTQLTITAGGSTNAFSVEKGGTKALVAVAVDSKGKTLSSVPLSYLSTNLYAFTNTAGSTSLTATATATNSGSTGLLLASCSHPNCNKNMAATFSNFVQGTVTGTMNPPTIYAGSTQSTSLVPIDASNGSPGTAITLPRVPNSILINQQGNRVVLGTDGGGVLIVDVSASPATISSMDSAANAKVLAISPDGAYVIAASSSAVYFIDAINKFPVGTQNISGVTSASFAPDSRFAWLSTGDTVAYVWDGQSTARSVDASGVVNSVAVHAGGRIAYLAQPGAVTARATCDQTTDVDSQTAGTPTVISALPDGKGAVAVDGSELVLISDASISQACPPAVSESRSAISLGGVAAKRLYVSPDSSKAVAIGDNAIRLANLTGGTSAAVNLTGSVNAVYTGAFTSDSQSFYVGASDGNVHRISLSNGSDAQQINPALKNPSGTAVNPDLVAVRSR